ncbi:MAG: acyl-CoA thioesterase [Maricaulaceae bacterium]
MSAALDPAGWRAPEPFIWTVTARDEDVDAFGHVNNAVYSRWQDRCAWAHSAADGLTAAVCAETRRGVALIEARLSFRKPVLSGDALAVGVWIAAVERGLKAERWFQIRRRHDGATVFESRCFYVCIELDTGKPARMPKAFLAHYRANPHITEAEAALPVPAPGSEGY